ncbi:hypothetical protein AAZX31_05G085800 [Glycine max]
MRFTALQVRRTHPSVVATPMPELHRTKSDTSSMLDATEAVARHHRAMDVRANSAISGSEASIKKKKGKKKKTKAMKSSSVVSSVNETNLILGDTVLPRRNHKLYL